jgi:TetR/AcrR family fatty acid metabolism transcriptional regulator
MPPVLPAAALPAVRTTSPPRPRRRTKSARDERPAPAARGDKRDAILRAAIRVFADRGFFGAQVADVARVAGVAAGTVYLYFRGKDDLLVSIFDRVMSEALEEGRAALAGVSDPVEQLRRLARLHLQRVSRDRDLTIVFQVELRQSTKFMERFSTTKLREYLGRIRDAIAAGQAAGVVRADVNPTLAAKMLFGALDEMATNWMLSRRASLDGVADQIVDMFVFGIGSGLGAQGSGARGLRVNPEPLES